MNETAPLRLRQGEAEIQRQAPIKLPRLPRRRAARRFPTALVLFLIFVAAPTILAAGYAWFFASDIYVSEARFWVRGQKSGQSNVLAPMLGLPGNGTSLEETLSIQDYVMSHDAVVALDSRIGLRDLYSHSGIDYFSRLPKSAKLERVVDYHRTMVDVRHNTQSGLVTLRVQGYRPEDAKKLLDAILVLSEELINRFNSDAQQEALRVARSEVKLAEERVARVREQLTAFREKTRTIDPSQPMASVIAIIASLEAKLASTRAELAEAEASYSAESQQVKVLRTRISALVSEIEREKSRLTGEQGALAPIIAEYEKLQIQREFADKGLASALASLETARSDAQRQQLFIVRVVSPNVPERPDVWAKWMKVVVIFCGTLLCFGIGALLVAGIRDRVI